MTVIMMLLLQTKLIIIITVFPFMKRRFFSVLLGALFLVSHPKANAADEYPVKSFELEVALGATFPIDKYVGNNQLGPALSLEGRYNFNQVPFDLGLEIYMGSTARRFEDSNLSNRIASVSLFSDYNFMRGSKIFPFIGVGIGYASCDVVQGSYGDDAKKVLVTPRLGVELFRHLRLTCYSRLCMKGYNNFGVSVGYAFGGGHRK